MYYQNYYAGMNFIWWAIWIIMLFWIFAIPYKIPGQRDPKEQPLDILKKRFASGKITLKEFDEMKKTLEN